MADDVIFRSSSGPVVRRRRSRSSSTPSVRSSTVTPGLGLRRRLIATHISYGSSLRLPHHVRGTTPEDRPSGYRGREGHEYETRR